ncbi:hypothetical protein JXQ31_15335 [candidate division KSB1 bacterium]|nr:hypothetical protein [candidate division KSB1 bacterium]
MKKSDLHYNKEHNKFEKLALPFQRRLYRTALILTKSSHHAKELVQETNLSARKLYYQLELSTDFDFGVWLFQLLMNNYMSDLGRFERI